MLVLGICLGLFVISLILIKTSDCMDDQKFCGEVIMIISGACIVIGLIAKPVEKYETMAAISEHNATRQTLENARKNGNDWEITTIQTKIIEANSWLASKKYYNNTIWGWWIPDEINDVEPIR